MSIKISGFQVGASFSLPQYGSLPTYYAIGLGGQHGGTGLIQVSYDAPANSTSLVFTASDAGGNNSDAYIQGYNSLFSQYNGGAQYWEYVNISSKDNASPVTNEIATSTGFVQGNFIAIVETLKGVSSTPTLVDSFGGQASNGNTCSFNITVNDGEIIVLATGVEIGTPQVTSMVTPGLTWVRKSSKSQISSFSNVDVQTLEIWYAINNSGSSIADTVTITYNGYYDDQAASAVTYSGVDLNSPWA